MVGKCNASSSQLARPANQESHNLLGQIIFFCCFLSCCTIVAAAAFGFTCAVSLSYLQQILYIRLNVTHRLHINLLACSIFSPSSRHLALNLRAHLLLKSSEALAMLLMLMLTLLHLHHPLHPLRPGGVSATKKKKKKQLQLWSREGKVHHFNLVSIQWLNAILFVLYFSIVTCAFAWLAAVLSNLVTFNCIKQQPGKMVPSQHQWRRCGEDATGTRH